MYKSIITIATIATALVILSAGSLVSDRAEAGASASAATKYARASSAGYQTWTRSWSTRRGTSEYSSSNRPSRR